MKPSTEYNLSAWDVKTAQPVRTAVLWCLLTVPSRHVNVGLLKPLLSTSVLSQQAALFQVDMLEMRCGKLQSVNFWSAAASSEVRANASPLVLQAASLKHRDQTFAATSM